MFKICFRYDLGGATIHAASCAVVGLTWLARPGGGPGSKRPGTAVLSPYYHTLYEEL